MRCAACSTHSAQNLTRPCPLPTPSSPLPWTWIQMQTPEGNIQRRSLLQPARAGSGGQAGCSTPGGASSSSVPRAAGPSPTSTFRFRWPWEGWSGGGGRTGATAPTTPMLAAGAGSGRAAAPSPAAEAGPGPRGTLGPGVVPLREDASWQLPSSRGAAGMPRPEAGAGAGAEAGLAALGSGTPETYTRTRGLTESEVAMVGSMLSSMLKNRGLGPASSPTATGQGGSGAARYR